MAGEAAVPGSSIAEQAIAGIPASQGEAAPAAAAPEAAGAVAFADEDAAMAARIAEQDRLDAETARLKAEQAGAAPAADPGAAAPAGAPAAEAPAAGAKPAKQQDPRDAAIIGLRKKNQELSAQLLISKGEAGAFRELASRGANPAGDGSVAAEADTITIDDRLGQIDAELIDLAGQYDNGQLSMSELRKAEAGLKKEERELVLQQNAALAEEVARRGAAPQTDLALESETDRILAEVPVLETLTKAQMDSLRNKAYSDAEFEGKPIGEGPQATLELRRRMALLAEQKYAPEAYKARLERKPGAPAPANQPGPGGRPAPTAAQREAKLELAAGMPPEIGKSGQGGSAGEMTTEEFERQYSALNEQGRLDFLRLHPALTQKVMGTSYRHRA